MDSATKEFLTTKEVMAFLGIARPTIYKYVSEEKLTIYHSEIGNRSLFKRSEVEKLNNVSPGKRVVNSSAEKAVTIEPELLVELMRRAVLPDSEFLTEAESEADSNAFLDKLEREYSQQLATAS